MSTNTTHAQSHVPPITEHARERWDERFDHDRPLAVAWRQACSVEAPAAWSDDARVYEPENALLLVHDGWLRTVLYNDGRLTGAGFTICEECGCPVNPIADAVCPACDAPQPSERVCGNITVCRGGDN